MRSTRIKENCTITGFDGKHTENHVRLIPSFLGSHVVHLPEQLVLPSWRVNYSSLTASLIWCRNPTLYLLRTLMSKVAILPTVVTRTNIASSLLGWIRPWLLGW